MQSCRKRGAIATKMNDRNPQKAEVILLLHPMFATAELMEQLLAEPLGEEYRILIPDLSGHGEAVKQRYLGAAQEAEAIYQYLIEHRIHRIKLAFAASLGGVVLMELMRKPELELEHLFFEGASFQEHGALVGAISKWILRSKHRKAVKQPELAVKRMNQLYGAKAAPIMASQMVAIQESNLEQMVWDCAHVRLPTIIPEQQKRCVFAYGEKDSDLKLAQKCLPKRYPYAQLVIWKGYDHCTKITEDAAEYGNVLRKCLL